MIAISAAAAVGALSLVGWFLFQVKATLDGKAPVSCGEAVRFVRAVEPPEGTQHKRCTKGQWQTTWYNLSFQIPQAEAETWLRASYPDATVRHCADADLCSDGSIGTGKDGLADHVRVEIRFGERGLAHVEIYGGTLT
ncbi:hypothetical protein HYE82_11755 [Streptomyces sp. BR123]|uniref:hypothetical protein n=1 Tax=Streptomyces sp. BR123 TaxID=2749828 RepID=UPI0015C4C529|nr:hypothetical protein [Streptomyces sp. BR123]NXY95055.1 hypothetical protein [Streptomyces sp. BR123]